DDIDTLPSTRNIPKKSSQTPLFEVGSYPGTFMKTIEQHLADRHSLFTNNSGSGSFTIQEMISQPSPSSSQQHLFHHYQPTPPLPTTSTSSFLNEQFLLSAAALAASHSYPPPSSFLSSLAASNLLSSINAHIYSISPEQQGTTSTTNYLTNFNDNYNDKTKKLHDHQSSPIDVKNLIGSSLTALGLDNVNEDEFDKAATNEQNNALLLTDDDIESFERSTTPATNNTSPTHLTTISSS
ncbi:unnamed protein product, partial [Rotaria sp. Silwood1]